MQKKDGVSLDSCNGFGEIFKYCDQDGLKILENSNMIFKNPLLFNDPFESKYVLISEYYREGLEEILKIKVSEKGESYINFLANIEELNKSIGADFNKYFELLAEIHQHDVISRMTKFTSFSKQDNSPAMWAHYADSGKGVVIGFDAEILVDSLKSVNSELDFVCMDVSYIDERPKFSGDIEKIKFVAYKSRFWSYEEEIRIAFESSELEEVKVFCGFDQSCISKIIFGIKFDPKKIADFCDRNRESLEKNKIKVYFSAIDRIFYSYRYVQIDINDDRNVMLLKVYGERADIDIDKLIDIVLLG